MTIPVKRPSNEPIRVCDRNEEDYIYYNKLVVADSRGGVYPPLIVRTNNRKPWRPLRNSTAFLF